MPDADFSLAPPDGPLRLDGATLRLPDGRGVTVERGTAALAATALLACEALGTDVPRALLAGMSVRATAAAASMPGCATTPPASRRGV